MEELFVNGYLGILSLIFYKTHRRTKCRIFHLESKKITEMGIYLRNKEIFHKAEKHSVDLINNFTIIKDRWEIRELYELMNILSLNDMTLKTTVSRHILCTLIRVVQSLQFEFCILKKKSYFDVGGIWYGEIM